MNNVYIADRRFSRLVAVMRQQLSLSQEDLARELGVSFATVNRWENGRNIPSRLARAQLNAFCAKMTKRGLLVLRNCGRNNTDEENRREAGGLADDDGGTGHDKGNQDENQREAGPKSPVYRS